MTFKEGTYAQYVSAKEEWLAYCPKTLPLHEAGQVPLVALTAWQVAALHRRVTKQCNLSSIVCVQHTVCTFTEYIPVLSTHWQTCNCKDIALPVRYPWASLPCCAMLNMDAQHDNGYQSTVCLSAGNVRLGNQVWEQSSGACWILRSRDLGPANS